MEGTRTMPLSTCAAMANLSVRSGGGHPVEVPGAKMPLSVGAASAGKEKELVH